MHNPDGELREKLVLKEIPVWASQEWSLKWHVCECVHLLEDRGSLPALQPGQQSSDKHQPVFVNDCSRSAYPAASVPSHINSRARIFKQNVDQLHSQVWQQGDHLGWAQLRIFAQRKTAQTWLPSWSSRSNSKYRIGALNSESWLTDFIVYRCKLLWWQNLCRK